MPVKTYSHVAARHTATHSAASSMRIATTKHKGAAHGMPRFARAVPAAVKVPAPAPAKSAPVQKQPLVKPAAASALTPILPDLRARRSPPRSSAPSFVSKTQSTKSHDHWEHEAARLVSRVQSGTLAKSGPKDAPTAGLRTTPAHPGVGPSPPSPDAAAHSPLPPAARHPLETHTGFDLGFVRVVTGHKTEAKAASLGAKAFAQNGLIHLGAGASVADVALLAHETAHVLQQTQPAHKLGKIGLSSAPATLPLRQPVGFTPFTERQLAQDRLAYGEFGIGDPLSTPRFFLPSALTKTLDWIGDEGLDLRLTRALPEAISPTLDPLRKLQDWWKVGRRQADMFSTRKALWEGILTGATQTDDPTIVGAARKIADNLPRFLGLRWTDLQHMMENTIAVANGSVSKWRDGLASLAPKIAILFDSLESGLSAALHEFEDTPWVAESIRTALGCPDVCRDAASISAWAGQLRAQADSLIRSLAGPAGGVTTAQFSTSVMTGIADLNPDARALGANLTAMADVMDKPEGLILQRDTLVSVLPRIHKQIGALDSSLASATEGMSFALTGLCYDFGAWGKAGALAFFPNEFDWMSQSAAEVDEWAGDQEPTAFELVGGTLGGMDTWDLLVTETVTEEGELDEEVATYGSGWRRIFAPVWWALRSKDKLIEKLIKKVPLLRELVENAAGLWRRAGSLFGRFKERVFKEGRILAPLWEFFLGVIGLELPAEFVSDVAQRGGSLLGKILRHPFQFLGNLAKGIAHGFHNFAKNIGTHLLNGVLEWLLGEFDLKPPVTFGRIVQALMERIGFSRKTVSERIVEYLKKKGRTTTVAEIDAKLEKAIKYGTTALRWLKLLFDGKYAEFWQEIKNQLVKLWQWVIDKAVTYVVDQLKKKLLTWLTRFLDPTGIIAVLTAIKAIYDAIQTITRYAEQMLAMAREVFRAVREIADGQIERAATWIEQAAAKGLAVAVAFFARLVGLNSVVDYLKKGLDEVKALVVSGLDTVVALAGEVWEWLVEKAEQAKEWWKSRRHFSDINGNDREIYYSTSSTKARLQITQPQSSGQLSVSATPLTLHEYLAAFKPSTDRERGVQAELTRIANDIDEIKADSDGSFGTTDGEKIYVLFNDAVLFLAELGGKAVPPATNIKWTTRSILGNDFPIKMVANPLSIDPGSYIGSKPVADGTKLWDSVRKHGSTYIRGHLLNHHLHGPGTWENMIPIARTTNTQMEKIAESDVKKAVIGQNKVVRYEVEMTDFKKHKPRAATDPENELPAKIVMNAWELKYNRGGWDKKGDIIVNNKELKNEVRTN